MRWNATTASQGNGSSIARIVSGHSRSRAAAYGARLLISTNCPSLRDFRLQIQHTTVDRDEQVRKATAAIDTISESRIRRADLSLSQERLNELHNGLASLRRENDRGEPAVT